MKYLSVLFVITFLFMSCRKDDDTEPPSVVITAPAAGTNYDVTDVFTVTVELSDNVALSKLEVRVVTQDLIQALPTSTHQVSGSVQTLNVVYALDDVRMLSGAYFIEAIAYDEAGNTEHAFVQINVAAVPLRLKGVIAATVAGNTVTIGEIDSLWNYNSLALHTSDFTDLAVSSWWQQAAFTGKITGAFRSWSFDGNYPGWTTSAFPSTGDYWGKCDAIEREWYINFRADGVIRAKSWNGQNTTQYTANAGYFFNAFTCSGDYFFADQVDASGVNRVLAVFDKQTGGGAVQQTALNTVPLMLFPRDNNSIFIASNSGGQGKLLIYDFAMNGTWEPVALPVGQLISAAQVDSNTLLLSMSDGNIYKFTYNPVGVISWLASSAQHIRYDVAGNTVITSEGTNVRQYNYANAVMINTVMLPDSAADLELRYNR
jgi:Bacterial Ig domain